MRVDTPHDVPTHMLENPERWITKVGKFLRKTSLDELPQIFNIFMGQMSIIGPRPALWNQTDLLAERDKYGANDVKPGLTGFAQINGRDELEIEEKARLDGEYVKKLSFFFDCKCFFGTIKSVLKHDGVVEGGTGEIYREEQAEKESKKRILVVSQNYYPEQFRITDICEELVKRGHEVTVITGLPNYPEGKIFDGYKHGKKRDEVINGVKVHRCFTVGRHHGAFFRLLNYNSFARSSKRYAKKLKEKYDVVFVNQLSPVMMAKAGIAYKKKHGTKLVLYCLDLWPESLVVGGIKRKSLIYKHYRRVSAKIYRQADEILVTSMNFSEYFKEHFGIEDTQYLPQYAEDLFLPENCKKESDGFIDLMFAGNIGTAQSVKTVIEAARRMQDIKNLRWHIVGDGVELQNVKNSAEGLDNVCFYGKHPLEEMPKYYSMADAMLVTLGKDPIGSSTLPGKVQTYMSAGKPIIGAIDGETKKIIEDAACGYCGESENVEQLVENVKKFIESGDKTVMSENARKYYNENFARDGFFKELETVLKDNT